MPAALAYRQLYNLHLQQKIVSANVQTTYSIYAYWSYAFQGKQ